MYYYEQLETREFQERMEYNKALRQIKKIECKVLGLFNNLRVYQVKATWIFTEKSYMFALGNNFEKKVI